MPLALPLSCRKYLPPPHPTLISQNIYTQCPHAQKQAEAGLHDSLGLEGAHKGSLLKMHVCVLKDMSTFVLEHGCVLFLQISKNKQLFKLGRKVLPLNFQG